MSVREITPPTEEEILLVKELRASGMSWRSIAETEHFDVSSQRLHQKFGHLITDGGPWEKSKQNRVDLARNIQEFLEEYGPLPREVVMEKFNIKASTLSKLPGIDRTLFLASEGKWANAAKGIEPTWSDQAIVAAMQKAYAQTGESGRRKRAVLSTGLYQEWYKEQPKGSVPSLPTIVNRLTWRGACEKAGLTAGRARASGYTKKWDRDDMLRAVAEYVDMCLEQGITCTYNGFEAEQVKHPEWPSGSRIRQLLGMTWSQAVLASAHVDAA